MATARAVYLVRRPEGAFAAEDFAVRESPAGEPGPGEVAVQSLILSIDPYYRLAVEDPAILGRVLPGGAIGRVTASRHPRFAEGVLVRHRAGMRETLVVNGDTLIPFTAEPGLDLTVQMHALGGIGLCAWGGLLETGKLKAGEQVFVSAAAGAVGSLAVQIAKLTGARVVGSAGSAEKLAWLRELGADAAINYREGDLAAALAAATPQGIDVYFDNVGGAHLDAALPRMNKNGRIPVCGMISAYNAGGSAVSLLHTMIFPRVTIKGFGFDEFAHLEERFRSDMSGWLKSGAMQTRETILEGIESVPEAVMGLFTGKNFGKTLVRIAA